MQVLRKITIKTCGDFSIGRIKEVLNEKDIKEGEQVALLKIVGECNGAKSGQTDKGEFTKLTGNFVGTDMMTGELYQSAVCILPEFVGAAIGAAALQSGNVRFAFEIGAKRKDNALTGYEFVVKPLIETKPTDAVLELMQLAGIKAPETPVLSAPAAAKPEKVKEKAKEAAK